MPNPKMIKTICELTNTQLKSDGLLGKVTTWMVCSNCFAERFE